ncbi:HlyD family secretion protein [Arcticibacter tournemirensis]|uniref:HlyD family efflux transporter periplasmic adaptor subunit n=1 Tax=Arcticibacter tournemirensis TaxID=699437 RepID=A0A5M9HCK0_9SPHI|nr:HlyD family efflux transporter periplasmic adaptor subunit [Arcticibacter tournemirensis]KAA8484450.1 HlyD family efflux transporter periplasmic adaptor subunit [Arcticibacter tournemirensis]TQM49896.1 HlyD family secretion protein [Arcticibacter tournemirensis]
MDRVLPKKKWNNKRITTVAGITALVLLISGSIYFTSGKSKLNVDAERITVSEIHKGKFQEFIPVNGIVMPLTTIYLDAAEGGRVEEKYVEDGAMMKKGDPIMRLSNTDLELTLANQETAVFDVLTQMQNTRNNSQENTISKLNQLADVDNGLKEAERKYKMNKKLYADRIIGLQEFQATENEYNYQLRKRRLADRVLKQDSVSVKQQLSQMNESYERMTNALQLMKKKVGDLVVRAPVDGQLTSMDAEIGQNKNKGERLGQIDVLSGFKVRADIDEHYIARIFPGLMGDFTLGDKVYKLRIKKVFTQVTNGRFQVDMEFIGKAASNIRRGQTLQVRLALGDETQALLLARGGFYQQTGGNWVFKMSKDGKTAYKTDIQLGRQNPDYYEILSGLEPGDKVITSSYENFGDVQELVLKK